jgi:lipase maturation factor 1
MFATLSIADTPKFEAKHSLALAHSFVGAVMLSWVFYATTVDMMNMPLGMTPFTRAPIVALEPFRIANRYGLFAVMTGGRYEIEFQGSNDGTAWTPYPFRYKPQALDARPRIYAPWQPRLDWNLWFASLGSWRSYPIVPLTETRLLTGSPDVLGLFDANPFRMHPPKYVRAVLYQYWFTTMTEKRATGNWWKRQYMGVYAPVITRKTNGNFTMVAMPDDLPEHD